MKSCPQCGKSENEISMETGRENAEENRAWCPCGWEGTYADMGNPVPKDDKCVAPPNQENDPNKMTKAQLTEYLDAFKVEYTPTAKKDELVALYIAEEAKHVAPSVDETLKVTTELIAEAEALGMGIKEGTTDDEIRALIEKAKEDQANQ